MKIAFICVNYNNSKVTIDYVNSVLSFKNDCFLDVIIVDNASEVKETILLDEITFPEVKILKSDKNLGYFKGLNIGIDSINSNEYDFIIIGNNDLVFDNFFIQNLISKSFNDNVLVIAPNIIKLDGTHQNPHIVNRFSKIERIYRRVYFINFYFASILQFLYNLLRENIKNQDRENNDIEQEILMGYGACYILTKNFFKHFTRLDDSLFLMGEEGLLANQIISVNGVTLYRPDIIVNHHDHSSIGKLTNKKLYSFSRESYYYYLHNLKHVQ